MNVLDFHSHILPGADHGSTSPEVTLKQLTFAKSAGVERIVATPHFYPHKHDIESFLKRRASAIDKLRAVYTKDMPKIAIGAEVFLCVSLDKLTNIEQLCISGSRTILLELPMNDFSSEYVDTVARIKDMGFDVILAHADRYLRYNIELLMREGAKLQLNASSLIGIFKRKYLFDWIERGDVSALGSDIHGSDRGAYRRFNKAIKIIGKDISKIAEASDRLWDTFRVFE